MTSWITLPQAGVVVGQSGHITDHDDITAALSTLWGAAAQGTLNVMAPPYSAVGDGTTDDTAAIQAALNAAAPGAQVLLPPATFATSAPLTIPPQVQLVGAHSSHLDATSGSCIKPLATFTGAAVLLMVDQTTGGYAIASNQQSVRMLTIDGSNLTGSTIDGILVQGFVHGLILEDLQIKNMPNHGINATSNGSGFAYSWRGTRLVVQASGGYGYAVGGQTDSTWIDCEALGCQKSGFLLAAQASNTKFIGCRSEYSNFNGWEISGTWTGATAAGGPTLIDCSTDGNNRNGISITATGDSPITIIGGSFRRDGANGTSGGGNYAGIQCTGSTIPVKIVSPTVFPGVANTGGANSPQIGFAVNGSAANVSVDGGILHAATTAWSDDGTNSNVQRGANITERVGTEASYTTAFHGVQTSLATPPTWDSGSGSTIYPLVADLLMPEDIGYIAATAAPDTFTSVTTTVTSGTIYLAKIVIRKPVTITNINVFVSTAGATLTSGQNLAGIYSATGTLLKATTDQSTAWTTTGLKTMALTSTLAVAPGFYYVAILAVGTTPPMFIRTGITGGGVGSGQNFSNVGTTASTPRSASLAGQTSLPASITLSSTSQALAYVTGAILT